jgi:hypothetical protein
MGTHLNHATIPMTEWVTTLNNQRSLRDVDFTLSEVLNFLLDEEGVIEDTLGVKSDAKTDSVISA